MKRIIIRTSLIISIVACVGVFALELTRVKGKLNDFNNRLTAQTAAREKAEKPPAAAAKLPIERPVDPFEPPPSDPTVHA